MYMCAPHAHRTRSCASSSGCRLAQSSVAGGTCWSRLDSTRAATPTMHQTIQPHMHACVYVCLFLLPSLPHRLSVFGCLYLCLGLFFPSFSSLLCPIFRLWSVHTARATHNNNNTHTTHTTRTVTAVGVAHAHAPARVALNVLWSVARVKWCTWRGLQTNVIDSSMCMKWHIRYLRCVFISMAAAASSSAVPPAVAAA